MKSKKYQTVSSIWKSNQIIVGFSVPKSEILIWKYKD